MSKVLINDVPKDALVFGIASGMNTASGLNSNASWSRKRPGIIRK